MNFIKILLIGVIAISTIALSGCSRNTTGYNNSVGNNNGNGIVVNDNMNGYGNGGLTR